MQQPVAVARSGALFGTVYGVLLAPGHVVLRARGSPLGLMLGAALLLAPWLVIGLPRMLEVHDPGLFPAASRALLDLVHDEDVGPGVQVLAAMAGLLGLVEVLAALGRVELVLEERGPLRVTWSRVLLASREWEVQRTALGGAVVRVAADTVLLSCGGEARALFRAHGHDLETVRDDCERITAALRGRDPAAGPEAERGAAAAAPGARRLLPALLAAGLAVVALVVWPEPRLPWEPAGANDLLRLLCVVAGSGSAGIALYFAGRWLARAAARRVLRAVARDHVDVFGPPPADSAPYVG